ncbi:DNA polymerase III subunit delta [Lacticaseibacillus mingshuiensis]|uniref:DNA polymerase III subunit delta n=1 Tax=Lacticaseibacillus mingshuiensis TaxID=2799574 RepID=UPI00195224D1|nr:DNA polymerase III subunit delta [Lacticaseibacillus mingshuiensis]
MRVADLTKQLKTGKVPPLVLLLGEETALQQEALAALAALIPEDQQTMNMASYDMRQTPVGVALDDATSQPFFGDLREVVITQPYFLTGETGAGKIDHDLAGLERYFKDPAPSTVMVIVAPYPKLDRRKKLTTALVKNSVTVDAQLMKSGEATAAINRELKKQGLALTRDGMAAFTQRTNANYSVMMHELPKLELYAQNGGALDEQAVSALVPRQLTDRVFDMVNAVVRRRADVALAIYRDLLLQKEEPIKLNSLLLSQFRLLLQVQILMRKGYDQGGIAAALKAAPFRIEMAMRESRGVEDAALRAAYLGLVDTEAAMKTGRIDKELAFELFVLKYCGQHRS